MAKLLDFLLGLLAGMFTKERLRQAGAGEEALAYAATARLDLPTFGEPSGAQEDRGRAAVVAFMRSQAGKPYHLGVEVQPGRESDASEWDCSELVEAAYRTAGMSIPDGSPSQYMYCRPTSVPKAGDLHFLWSEKWGRIGHVLVDSGEGTVLHAMGGRGVVEDPAYQWTSHARYRGCRRHPDFALPREERPS